jgi:hypothetical protein
VSTDDGTVDLPSAATAIATRAVERFESGATVAASAAPGVSAAASAAPGEVADSGLCALATPEEIAAAVGLDVTLTARELEGTCSYESLTDEGYTLIYVAQQDPAIFDAMVGSLDAEEVDGPGEANWWASSVLSLFSRQGDQVLQVSYSSSATTGDEEMKQAALAVMGALLAP